MVMPNVSPGRRCMNASRMRRAALILLSCRAACAGRADQRFGHAAAAVEHDHDLGALPDSVCVPPSRYGAADATMSVARLSAPVARSSARSNVRCGVGRPIGRARIRERARAVVEQRQRGQRQRPQQPRIRPVQMRQHGTPRSRSAASRSSASTLAAGGGPCGAASVERIPGCREQLRSIRSRSGAR